MTTTATRHQARRLPCRPVSTGTITLLTLLLLPACAEQTRTAPPPECAVAWSADAAVALVDQLEQATGLDHAVWLDYGVRDAAYVLNAGPSDSGGVCLGLWQAGRAVSYARTDQAPALLTPLYGYWFAANWQDAPDANVTGRGDHPASFAQWIESTGVSTAVILPVTIPDFPMELPALVKVQLGMHEAFHVDVQAPRWYAATGNWPVWDRQPDRRGLRVCYTSGDDVAAALAAEREHLATLIESLLDGDSTAACQAGRAFLEQRRQRYAMLDSIRVAAHDGTPVSCAVAEAIMELEEGTADWASWTVLYDLGIASRESLLRRYRALQDEAFYLTGAMQLHAIRLMRPDSLHLFARRIVESEGSDAGGPTALFTAEVESFCR